MNSLTYLPRQFARSILVKLAVIVITVSSTAVSAQSLITSAEFYDPDFEARRPGDPGFISLVFDTTLYTPASQTAGDVTWTHSAAGLVQAGIDQGLGNSVDIQLAAYTRTQDDFLRFGRVLDVTTAGILPDGTVTGLTDDVLGVSIANEWSSTATIANLNLGQGVLYSVQFNVATGAGINLSALSSADFTLLNGGTVIESINSDETLNVLDLLTVGGGLTTIDFQFYAPDGLTDLSLLFEAETVADANLLGGIAGNQTVLEFSGFSLAPVPEPGSMVLAFLGFLILLRPRRPCRV